MTNLAKSGPEKKMFCKLICRSTDLQMGQTERANLLNKSINGGRRHRYIYLMSFVFETTELIHDGKVAIIVG